MKREDNVIDAEGKFVDEEVKMEKKTSFIKKVGKALTSDVAKGIYFTAASAVVVGFATEGGRRIACKAFNAFDNRCKNNVPDVIDDVTNNDDIVDDFTEAAKEVGADVTEF